MICRAFEKKINIFLIVLVFILSFTPRLFVAVKTTALPQADAIGFNNLAKSILKGEGFKEDGHATAFKEPLYPFFLMLIYKIFGENYLIVRIVQAFLGALVCIYIFLISQQFFSGKVAFLSSLLAAFSPGLIMISSHLLSENLYAFLLILVVYFLALYSKENKGVFLFLSAIILGLTTLTRSIIAIFPIFILSFFFIYDKRNIKTKIRYSAIFMLFFALPILPWTYRNWVTFKKFIPVVSRTGLGLYSSYFPKDGKIFGYNASDSVTEKAKTLGSEAAESNFLMHKTVNFITSNPLKVLKLEILKTAYFWSPFDWEIIGYGIYNFMYCFIIPFFVFGVFIYFKKVRGLLIVYLPILYSFFIALVTYGSPRFRLPIEPFLMIIAAAGLSRFIDSEKNRLFRLGIVFMFFLANLFFYFNSFATKIFARTLAEKIHLW